MAGLNQNGAGYSVFFHHVQQQFNGTGMQIKLHTLFAIGEFGRIAALCARIAHGLRCYHFTAMPNFRDDFDGIRIPSAAGRGGTAADHDDIGRDFHRARLVGDISVRAGRQHVDGKAGHYKQPAVSLVDMLARQDPPYRRRFRLHLWLGERAGASRLRAELARRHADRPPVSVQPTLAASTGELGVVPTEYVGAFLALGDYFQNDMRWAAMDGAQMELGVASHPGPTPVADQGDAVVVSVRVLVAGEGEAAQIASSPTVLFRPGAQAEFRFAGVEAGQGSELAYRCAYPGGPDGLATVGVTIQGGPAGRPVHLWGAVRMDDDGSAPAAYARAGETRYMLFLAARPLNERRERDRQA